MDHKKMQRLITAVFVCLCSGGALAHALPQSKLAEGAEDLASGQLARLAQGGDTAAMLRLGETLWYGEGVPVDRARADALFEQAARAGNPDAAPLLRLSADRQAQQDDIAFWTSRIDARHLTGAEFNCKAPEFPQYSHIRMDVTKVAEKLEAYRICYNAYVDRLFGDVPSARRIPAATARLMSDGEFEQARLRIDGIVKAVLAELQERSAPVLAERDRWVGRSRDFIVQEAMRSRSNLAYAEAWRQSHAPPGK